MSTVTSSIVPANRASYFALPAAVGLCFLPSVVGIWHRPDEWFRELARPPGNPPDWVFGPVWTVLYTLMGVALWLASGSGPRAELRLPLALFATQLLLNAAWSWLFFGRHAIGWALADLILLTLLVGVTAVLFRRHSLASSILLGPYLGWLVFAGYLNAGYWLLNRNAGG